MKDEDLDWLVPKAVYLVVGVLTGAALGLGLYVYCVSSPWVWISIPACAALATLIGDPFIKFMKHILYLFWW